MWILSEIPPVRILPVWILSGVPPLTTHHSPRTTHHSQLPTRHSPPTPHHSPLTTLYFAGEQLDCSALPLSRQQWLARDDVSSWLRAASRLSAHRLTEGTRGLWMANLAELVAVEGVGVDRLVGFWAALSRCDPASDPAVV